MPEKGGTAEPFCRSWGSDLAGVVDIVEWHWIYSEQTPSLTAEKRHAVSAVCPASGPVCCVVSRTAYARCHVPTPSSWSLFSVAATAASTLTARSGRSPGLIAAGPPPPCLPVTTMARCRPKRCIRPEMHVGCRAEHMLFVNDPQLGRMAESAFSSAEADKISMGRRLFQSPSRAAEEGRRGGGTSPSGVRLGLVHRSSRFGENKGEPRDGGWLRPRWTMTRGPASFDSGRFR